MKDLATKLLRAHRDEIARAIVKQVDRFAPSMLQVDDRARAQSIAAYADAVADVLQGAPPKTASSLLRNSVRLRISGGVTREDILASSHLYLPAIRKLFIDKHPDLKAALAAYDQVEAVAIPLAVEIGKVVLSFDPTMLDEEPTNPTGRGPPPKHKRGKRALEHPFQSRSGEGE